ncbi:Transmembrane domain-containing protein [Cedratvirus Zaza IHUMI]|uniref:Transmembrane domain-containing protein n=1 Tax=Cedratvirus Zaza IHUMI TaxID=2126979 RepID=A0A2R8FFZ7_9VIRU|nr:Transmembrane domain-containing protein [Cedratvirus Zaza IHUMI]
MLRKAKGSHINGLSIFNLLLKWVIGAISYKKALIQRRLFFWGMNEDGDIIFYESGAGEFEEEGYTEAVNVEMRNILDSLPTTFSAAQTVNIMCQ